MISSREAKSEESQSSVTLGRGEQSQAVVAEDCRGERQVGESRTSESPWTLEPRVM